MLVALAVGAFGFKPTFDLSSAGIPASAESQTALVTLEKGLPPGATDPTEVLLHATSGRPLTAAELAAYGAKLKALPGVGSVAPPAQRGPGDRRLHGDAEHDPASTAAVNAIKNGDRPGAHAAAPAGTYALVGGTTAVFADIQRAVNHDYAVVFPVAAVIILLILVLLLRSLVAPWYLMASVGLGFGATLGASVLVFQDLRGQAGLVFLLPVYMYLFVVALGTDYNILMIARLREETAEGTAAAAGRRDRAAARRAGDRRGRADPGRHVRLADAGRQHHPVPARLRGLERDRAGRVRDGDVLLPGVTALLGRRAWWPGHADKARNAGRAALPRSRAVNPPGPCG